MSKRYRILLLEDNPYDAELTIHLISELSIDTEVVLCRSGKEFEQKLLQFAPHVVISDYDLPHYTGGKALTYLQKVDVNRLVPFILVSGVVPLERASEMMQKGMFDMIDKSNLQALGPALLRAVQVADERRQSHKQSELLRKVGAISRIGGWELDLRTNVLTWTDITKEVHEVPQDYEPKLETAILFFKEGWSRDLIEKCVREGVEDGKSYDVEIILVTAKGNERWVRTMGEAEFRDGECIRMFGVIQDLDEQIRARKEKETIAERHRAVLQAAKAVTWDWYIPTNRVYVDDNFVELAVPARIAVDMQMQEDAHGTYISIEDIAQLIHPDHRDDFQQKILAHLGGLTPVFEVEYQAYGREDNVLWVYNRGAVVEHDESGNPQRMIGSIVDVTNIRTLSDQVREKDDIIGSIADNVNGAIYRYALYPNGKDQVLYLNKGAEEFFGLALDKAKMRARLLFERIHPEDVSHLMEQIKEAVEKLHPLNNIFRLRSEDGTYRWIKNTALVQKQEDGTLIWDGFTVDVTAQVEDKNNFETAFRHDPVPKFLFRPNGGEIVDVNEQALQTYLYSRDELVGSPISILRGTDKPDSELKQIIQQIVKGEKTGTFLGNHKKKNGQHMQVEADANLIQYQGAPAILVVFRDITEELEARINFETIFKDSPLPSVLFSPTDGVIYDVNQKTIDLYGYAPSELIGKKISVLRGTDEPDTKLKELFKRVTSGKQLDHFIGQHFKKNGEQITVDASTSLLTYKGRQAAMVSFRDITEELAQKEELQKLSLVAEHSTNGVVIISDKGIIEWANDAFARITGFSLQEIRGEHARFLAEHNHTEKKDAQVLLKSMKDGKPTYIESLNRTKDGKEYWVEIFLSPIKDKAGNITNFVGIGNDITNRKRREQELEESRKQTEAALHELEQRNKAVDQHSIVAITDTHGVIQYVNDKFCETSGYTREELIGNTHRLISSGYHDVQFWQSMYATIAKGKVWHGVVRNRAKDGTLYWLRTTITPFTDSETGKVERYVAIRTDITPRIEAEAKLRKTLDNLEELVHQKTEKLEMAHQSVVQSLQYAQRLQQALIPSEQEWQHVVTNAGTILRPRDIVSGDFYWFRQFNDELIIALVDCTGHGVPGAMMSMLANELLNSVVAQKHIFRPDVVLEELDSLLNEQLMRQDTTKQMADGMDMSVVSIDRSNGLFSFAGAKSHGIYYHADTDEYEELKPVRHSIGGAMDGVIKDFDRIRFDFAPMDRFYLFSDGIYDQFGGPDGKKLNRKRLFQFIQQSKDLPVDEQVEFIEDKLLEWMGGGVQIDDISFVGIEI